MRPDRDKRAGGFTKIVAPGGPSERGFAYGRGAKAQIDGSLALYEQAYREIAGLGWSEAVARARAFEPAIAAAHPEAMTELEAIAKGAGVESDDILALNIRTEILFAAHSSRLLSGECTTCASVAPTGASGAEIVIGQNWDWKKGAAETVVILEYPDSPAGGMLTVVEAGLLAKSGLNATGLGLVFNSLVCDLDRQADRAEANALPIHVLLRACLDCESAEAAADLLGSSLRAASGNVMLADRGGSVINLELAPGQSETSWPVRLREGQIVHANHFLAAGTSVEDAGPLFAPDSPNRQARGEEMIESWNASAAIEQMQAMFRDHDGKPHSICAHPDESLPWIEQDATVASMIFDVVAGEAWIAAGLPCGAEYVRHVLPMR